MMGEQGKLGASRGGWGRAGEVAHARNHRPLEAEFKASLDIWQDPACFKTHNEKTSCHLYQW